MKNISALPALLFAVCFLQSGFCCAAEAGFDAIGIRTGFSATNKHEYFRQHEVFAVYGLPWDWRSAGGWGISPQLEITAGMLHGAGEDGFIGSVGPSVSLDLFEKRLKLDLGINIHALSRSVFGRQDFGSNLLFGVYAGANYRIFGNLGAGYRLQHVSLNKILYSGKTSNPGLDLHLFSVNWSF